MGNHSLFCEWAPLKSRTCVILPAGDSVLRQKWKVDNFAVICHPPPKLNNLTQSFLCCLFSKNQSDTTHVISGIRVGLAPKDVVERSAPLILSKRIERRTLSQNALQNLNARYRNKGIRLLFIKDTVILITLGGRELLSSGNETPVHQILYFLHRNANSPNPGTFRWKIC